MPEQRAIQRARADKRAGKSPSTQAGEFVKEEIDRVRSGKHGVRSAKQAVAIGLSEARRAGVDLKPPAKGKTSEATRKKAARDTAAGHGKKKNQRQHRIESETLAHDDRRVEAREQGGRVVSCNVEAGEERCRASSGREPLRRREEGRADQRRGRPLGSRKEGSPDAGGTCASSSLKHGLTRRRSVDFDVDGPPTVHDTHSLACSRGTACRAGPPSSQRLGADAGRDTTWPPLERY